MAVPLYFRHSDIATGTFSLTVGAHESAIYAVTNLGLILPFKPKPFKASSGTVTIRLTTSGSVTVKGFLVAGHNLPGVTITLTSGGGLSSSVVAPANTLDGLWTNIFKDLRAAAGTTSTTFDAAISGASANVRINKIFWVVQLREWNVSWGLKRGLYYPGDHLVTEKDVPSDYEADVRGRPLIGEMSRESDRAAMEQLFADSRGRSRVWGAVPNPAVNDFYLLHFTNDQLMFQTVEDAHSTVTIEAAEMGLGKAL